MDLDRLADAIRLNQYVVELNVSDAKIGATGAAALAGFFSSFVVLVPIEWFVYSTNRHSQREQKVGGDQSVG